MSYANALRAAEIVRDAGGRIVGRTRLQKIAYFLSASGLEDGFRFEYRHYGPFGDDLAIAVREAGLLGLLREVESQASWGGTYSTFTVEGPPNPAVHPSRLRLTAETVNADAIELELAATAVFLAIEGHPDPWTETERRKPEKAEQGRLDRAKALYQRLSAIETPSPWPAIG
jgi:uncharacterized protein